MNVWIQQGRRTIEQESDLRASRYAVLDKRMDDANLQLEASAGAVHRVHV